MKRILNSESIIKEAEVKWKKYVPKIIAQAKLEKGVNVEKKLKEIGLDDQDGKYICMPQRSDLTQCYTTDNNPVYYCHTSCQTAGQSQMVIKSSSCLCKDIIPEPVCFITSLHIQGTSIKIMLDHCPMHPIVVMAGDYRNVVQTMIVCEGKIMYDISADTIPVSLLSFYYVYNFCYPKGCNNFYTFIYSI